MFSGILYDHKTKTKPKPLGFDAICTQARLQKVLFLTKTKLKPKNQMPHEKYATLTKIQPSQLRFSPTCMVHVWTGMIYGRLTPKNQFFLKK